MLKVDYDREKRVHGATKTNFLQVSWTSQVVRFNEELQIIDVLDSLGVIYGSVTSATTAQTKWFGKHNTETTAKVMGVAEDELLYKIKWEDSARARLALKVTNMQQFLEKQLKHMPKSKDLALLIGSKDGLTVMGAYDGCLATYQKETTDTSLLPQLEVVNGTDTNAKALGWHQVWPCVPARRAEKTAILMCEATDAESGAKVAVANAVKAKAWHEAETARKKDELETRGNADAVNFRVQQENKVAEVSKWEKHLATAERLGMHEHAASLKRKISEAFGA